VDTSLSGGTSATSAATGPHAKKRYLILTYAGEFDRVHYPLPLAFEDAASVESMQRTIRRLRSELTHFRRVAPSGGGGTLESMGVGKLQVRFITPVHASNRLTDSIVVCAERARGDALEVERGTSGNLGRPSRSAGGTEAAR
jgi:hypothetical protein